MKKRQSLILIGIASLIIILSVGIVESSAIITFKLDTTNSSNVYEIKNSIIRDSNAVLEIETTKLALCKYSRSKGLSYELMEGSFDFSYNIFHNLNLLNLEDGTHAYYVRCKDFDGNISGELEAIFGVNVPVSATISYSETSPLKSGTIKLELVTSKPLSSSPSLSYTFDESSFRNLPVVGSGKIWTSYLIISSDVGEKIGSFRFNGKDLEGFNGNMITSGGIFLVDTIPPRTIKEMSVEGYESRIDLDYFTDEKISKFNIYRSTSPGVTKSNFYKQVNTNSYSDTSVDKGKTYYYRISSIDSAGNEGELSVEGYATVLLSESSSSTTSNGLELRYHGQVDNFIVEIEDTLSLIQIIKNKFNNGEDKESVLYSDLKLDRDVDNSINEINSLKREVENYKNQNLNQNELNNKLNSAKLKLNSIKKKVPESIILIKELNSDNTYDLNDVLNILLLIKSDLNDISLDKMSKRSFSDKENYEFIVKRAGYNIEVVFLDGTREELSLIKEKITSLSITNENITIIESIPREIAQSIVDVEIKNQNYDVVKEDTIISFGRETREIVYEIRDKIDLSSINNIKTILYNQQEEEQKSSSLTGYFSYNPAKSSSLYGIVVGIIVVFILSVYFINTRSKRVTLDKLKPFKKLIGETLDVYNRGEKEEAYSLYGSISNSYKLLSNKEKQIIYPHIENLSREMNIK